MCMTTTTTRNVPQSSNSTAASRAVKPNRWHDGSPRRSGARRIYLTSHTIVPARKERLRQYRRNRNAIRRQIGALRTIRLKGTILVPNIPSGNPLGALVRLASPTASPPRGRGRATGNSENSLRK